MILRYLLVALLLVTPVLAGCIGTDDTDETIEPAQTDRPAAVDWQALGASIFDDHVHSDRALHEEVQEKVEVLASTTLSDDNKSLGQYIEADVQRNLVAVGIVTGEAKDMTVVLLDAKALPDIVELGRFSVPEAYGDVKIDPELDLVYVPTALGAIGQDATFTIWDVSDPSNPERVGRAEGAGCHMLHPMHVDGTPYVWCTSLAGAATYRIVEQPTGGYSGLLVGSLTPQSDPETTRYASYYGDGLGAAISPIALAANHDMTAQPDPVTGDPVAVTAHELQGIRVYDVSTPEAPVELSAWRGEGMDAPFDRLHTAALIEIDGRRIAVGATETFTDVEPALYLVDMTDWSNPEFLARWTPPGIESDQEIVYSLHNFQFVGERLYLTNGHAGTWVLNLSDPAHPRPVAQRTPVWDTEFPYPGMALSEDASASTSWLWDVIVVDGYTLTTDVPAGIEVLRFDGDPAGDPAWRGFV